MIQGTEQTAQKSRHQLRTDWFVKRQELEFEAEKKRRW
jgi:hypothetical protein